MQVPLLDLRQQYAEPLRREIRHAIDTVCDEQSLILGPHVESFEKKLAAYCGTKHAIGVSSGTDALLISLMTLVMISAIVIFRRGISNTYINIDQKMVLNTTT